MTAFIDLTGQKFGKFTALERMPNKGKHTMWLCSCDCGNTRVISSTHLRTSHSRSCGCLNIEKLKARSTVHGMSHTRLFKIWSGMRERCSLESHSSYVNYGGRGISVCKEWEESFVAFRDWAYINGYTDDKTIDRIDANGHYCPDNCRWATIHEQSNNKRNNRFIEMDGVTHTLAEWSKICGVKESTLWFRLKKGWSIERAIKEQTHPTGPYKKTTE